MDVVIPHGVGSEWDDCNELKYCLRSLEKNFLDLRNVYIVGHKPEWLSKEAIHLQVGDPLKRNKDGNIINKVLIACLRKELSDDFLRLSDDQLILKPLYSKDIIPYYYDDLKDTIIKIQSRWVDRVKNTRDLLLREGLTTYRYEVHCPFIYNKYKFMEVMSKYPYDDDGESGGPGAGFIINTLYFNHLNKRGRVNKIDHSIKLSLEKHYKRESEHFDQEHHDDLMNRIEGRKYLGYNGRGLDMELELIIKTMFSKKSKYEL